MSTTPMVKINGQKEEKIHWIVSKVNICLLTSQSAREPTLGAAAPARAAPFQGHRSVPGTPLVSRLPHSPSSNAITSPSQGVSSLTVALFPPSNALGIRDRKQELTTVQTANNLTLGGWFTCWPWVLWNSWATAAKASELGSCGTAGTELVVASGGSEETLTGGGGEPKKEKDVKA